MYVWLTLVENERKWASAKYKLWIFGGKYKIVENQILVQNTRNKKTVSQKYSLSKGGAKVHGFQVVQNTTCKKSSAKYSFCP